MFTAIVVGTLALLLMLYVEWSSARVQQRRPQYRPILTAGTVGMVFFIYLLYAGGFV